MHKKPVTSLLVCAAILILTGCTHKTDAGAELEKAAEALAKTDPAQPVPAPPVQAAPAQQPNEPTPAQTAAVPPPAQQLQQALAAYKAGELEDAVTRLQKLRAAPILTPQQRMAVQDSVAAVMTEVYTMAAKGDSRAIAAVKQYEHMQTTPH